MKIELHRITTEMMLWSLGGFEEPRRPMARGWGGWSEEQITELVQLVTTAPRDEKGYLARGVLGQLARRFNKVPDAVIQEIVRLKRQGRVSFVDKDKYGRRPRWSAEYVAQIRCLALAEYAPGRRLPPGAPLRIAQSVGRTLPQVTAVLRRLRDCGELPHTGRKVRHSTYADAA